MSQNMSSTAHVIDALRVINSLGNTARLSALMQLYYINT